MITNKSNEQVNPENKFENPFYLLCNGKPLPLQVKQGDKEACKWRDLWESCATKEDKLNTGYHPTKRVWVGGFEDGKEVVEEARIAYA